MDACRDMEDGSPFKKAGMRLGARIKGTIGKEDCSIVSLTIPFPKIPKSTQGLFQKTEIVSKYSENPKA